MKRAGQEPNGSTSTPAEPRKSEHFLVGKDSADQWVARDEYGRRGGIFTNQPDALHFARREVGDTPCAIVLVAEPLELFVRPGGGTVANDNSTNDARARIRVRVRPTRLWAQGDILIEQVEDSPVSSQLLRPPISGALLVAEGEAAGHRHRIVGSVVTYCDDEQARSVPNGLYIAHLHVSSPNARLEHEEHAPIELEQGTYRIRRQRQLEPTDWSRTNLTVEEFLRFISRCSSQNRVLCDGMWSSTAFESGRVRRSWPCSRPPITTPMPTSILSI